MKSDNVLTWRLQEIGEIDWTSDNSGLYALINWSDKLQVVRIDLMSDNHDALQSFQGKSDNVRKACLNWLSDNKFDLSLAHAGYIGSEIERADHYRTKYVQDSGPIIEVQK